MQTTVSPSIAPEEVRATLERHMLAKGMLPLVLDMERSRGMLLYDKVTGKEYYDFFGFYASNALGMNHPKLIEDAAFLHRLRQAALNKVTNSDVQTEYLAHFLAVFSRIAIPEYLHYAFFIEGGTLAVENALKVAFDWKVRKNFARGYRREVGQQVMHFEQAFHGRGGYTLSLTNTADPRKTAYFPRFNWPRVLNPKIRFPQTEENLEQTEQDENLALAQAKMFFLEHKDDIACVIIEPIQGEGGDNHFRPEFLRQLKYLAQENEALLIFDEVQAGVGITGSFWAHQALDVEPDIMAFGKKTHVCGMLASRKLDEVGGHVFQEPSRINSTWGGNLADMVRFTKILEVVEEDDLVSNAARSGVYLQERLHDLAQAFPVVEAVRGRGLMCAFDLPDPAFRDLFIKRCYGLGLIIIGCGTSSIRFRPPLIIDKEHIDQGTAVMREALESMG